MAISEGVREHRAFLSVSGSLFAIKTGSVSLQATRQSSSFSARIPMFKDGAEQFFASLGENETQVIVQTGGAQGPLITGEIDSAQYDYAATQIAISGRCKSAKLHQTKTSEKWVNQTPDKIIQDLAGRVGLSAQVDSDSLQAGRYWNIDWTKLTDSVSYASTIHKLADLMGAKWWVDAQGELHVAKQGQGGSYSITYVAPTASSPARSDALQISVRRNIQAAKTTKVTVKSWNQKEKKLYTSTKQVAGVGGTTNYEYHIAGLTQDHADRHATNRANESTRHELSLQVSCVGDPSIDPSMKLQINGTPFAQTFDIDGIEHQIGMGGHKMTITARSAKSGRTAS